MKKVFIFLGFISAIAATVLSVTHLYQLAIAPIVVAFICGVILLYISKKGKTKTKTIQYIFLLVIISLSLTIYKNIFPKIDPNDSQLIEQQEGKSDKESEEIQKEEQTILDQ